MHGRTLRGCRIFYLEDDFYVAEDMREDLAEAGGEVVLCGNLPQAVDAVANAYFDAALLDINIHGSSSFEIARRLKDAGVPILFLSAYNADILPSDLSSCPLLTKPACADQIVREMRSLCDCGCATGRG